jgi:hypothetical protein
MTHLFHLSHWFSITFLAVAGVLIILGRRQN